MPDAGMVWRNRRLDNRKTRAASNLRPKKMDFWTGLSRWPTRGSDAVKLTWQEVSFEKKEIERVTQKRRKKVVLPINLELLFALEANMHGEILG